ncbi:MAG: COX15/CtaA family protein, partial [Candidatus Kapabacteria bacterium]|nr:COX15/CtaA family protein [Candidatus Kapabacteria bacterium]
VSLTAFLLVVVQGVLGGLTVMLRLPTAISVSHALVAQIFFACTILLALGTSSRWHLVPPLQMVSLRRFFRISLSVWSVSFVQILFGALTRHTYSALAIPDFPLVFGGIFPPAWALNEQVFLHYLHRLIGFVLAGLMFWQGWELCRSQVPGRYIWGIGSIVLVLGQVLVGGWLVWSLRAVFPTTLHVVLGTAIWALNTMLFIRLWRWQWLTQHAQLA